MTEAEELAALRGFATVVKKGIRVLTNPAAPPGMTISVYAGIKMALGVLEMTTGRQFDDVRVEMGLTLDDDAAFDAAMSEVVGDAVSGI